MKTKKRTMAFVGVGAALIPALAVGGTAFAGTAGAAVNGTHGTCAYTPTDGVATVGQYRDVQGPPVGVQLIRLYSPSARCIEFSATAAPNSNVPNSSIEDPNLAISFTGDGWGMQTVYDGPLGGTSKGTLSTKTQWFNDAGISIGANATYSGDVLLDYATNTTAAFTAKSSLAPY